MASFCPEDRYGIPYVEDGEFSYFPYNPAKLRAVKKSKRIAQAILSAQKERLGTILCTRDILHYQVRGNRCGKEYFLPGFVKEMLSRNMIPVAIVEQGAEAYIVDYNAILGVSDSGNFLNPYLLQSDVYDKIVISETPSLDGFDLQDTTAAMARALCDCSPDTQLVMLNYLVTNLNDEVSFEVFKDLVTRATRNKLLTLLDLCRRQFGEDNKLTGLLQVSITGTAGRQAV